LSQRLFYFEVVEMTHRFYEIDDFLTVEIRSGLDRTPNRVTLHARQHNGKSYNSEPGYIALQHSEMLTLLEGLTSGEWLQAGERLIADRDMSDDDSFGCPHRNWKITYTYLPGVAFAGVQESRGILFLPKLTLTKLCVKATEIRGHLQFVDHNEWVQPEPPQSQPIGCTCHQCIYGPDPSDDSAWVMLEVKEAAEKHN